MICHSVPVLSEAERVDSESLGDCRSTVRSLTFVRDDKTDSWDDKKAAVAMTSQGEPPVRLLPATVTLQSGENARPIRIFCRTWRRAPHHRQLDRSKMEVVAHSCAVSTR